MIPEYNDDSSAWTILEQIYDSIFDAELHAWHAETSDWPDNRTFEMFRDWFDITFVSEIADLSSGPFEMFRDWFDITFVSEIADLSSGPILDDATTIL